MPRRDDAPINPTVDSPEDEVAGISMEPADAQLDATTVEEARAIGPEVNADEYPSLETRVITPEVAAQEVVELPAASAVDQRSPNPVSGDRVPGAPRLVNGYYVYDNDVATEEEVQKVVTDDIDKTQDGDEDEVDITK